TLLGDCVHRESRELPHATPGCDALAHDVTRAAIIRPRSRPQARKHLPQPRPAIVARTDETDKGTPLSGHFTLSPGVQGLSRRVVETAASYVLRRGTG